MNEKGLLDLKQQIDEAIPQVGELKGKLDHLKNELKERFGCETLDDAEHKLKELRDESEQLQEKIDVKLEKIEEEYYD